jgi:pSer/pThr/pTyr-binding forkhead associated (FHA) protein
MRISLVPLDGGKPIILSIPIAIVGRGEECDFRLEDERVADMHCVLALSDGLLLLRDLGTGSIRVNGQPVRKVVLLPNSILDIAGVRFEVRYEDGT